MEEMPAASKDYQDLCPHPERMAAALEIFLLLHVLQEVNW